MTDAPAPAVDVTGLEASRNAILAEKKALQEKYATLERAAAAAGIDPADPGAFLTKREAESRARAERETRVKDAVTEHLLAAGVPVAPTIARSIVRAAIESSSVTLAEDGSVSGVAEHATEWLGLIKGNATPRPSPVPPPAGPMSNFGPPPPRLPRQPGLSTSQAGPTSFLDLVKQGPAAVTAFANAHPEAYVALKAAHEQGIATPRGGHPTG